MSKVVRKLTVPVGDVLVGDTGGNIEHDDTALAVDVVTVTETTKLLLTSSVPNIELNLTVVLKVALISGAGGGVSLELTYGGEAKRVNLDTEGGHVLLLELSSQVTLDKGGLSLIMLVAKSHRRQGKVGRHVGRRCGSP